MGKSWFNRLLLSYMPIFMIVVAFIFFVFFQVLGEQGRREAINANRMLSLQAMRLIDTSLRSIDNMVMKEMINSEPLKAFFNGKEGGDPYIDISAVMKMKDMIAYYPLIDSIYLVRYSDGAVLSNATNARIASYPDSDFIRRHRSSVTQQWSDVRTFRQFTVMDGKKVVSLVRGAPFLSNEQGMIVVNVATDSLYRIVRELYDPAVSFIRIHDGSGTELYHEPELPADVRVFADYTSGYSGWSYISGFVQSTYMQSVSLLYNAWFIVGLAMIAAGLLWMVYVTRRNVRPVEQIVTRVSEYGQPLTGGRPKPGRIDEFAFIESAIDRMKEQESQYRERYKEDLHLRTRDLFHRLIEEETPLTADDWRGEAERLQLPLPGDRHFLIVLEIDKYGEFCSGYSRYDQNLLKFAIRSIVYEQAAKSGYACWAEWTAAARLGIMLFEDGEERGGGLTLLCDGVRAWAEQNMKFTVSIGIGEPAERLTEIAGSYRQAMEALDYKMVLGENRLITIEEVRHQGQAEVYAYLGQIGSAVQSFRKLEDGWKEQLEGMFAQMGQGLLTKDEITSLMNYLLYSLGRELAALGKDVQSLWQDEALPRMSDGLRACHSLSAIQEAVLRGLTGLADTLAERRDSRQHAELIKEMRKFIEAEYANPNMSLEYLSDRFHINPKYVSKLFKETTGQKFVDFLIGIRLAEAKRLLAGTQSPIQDIAEEVGYTSAISFTRAFKKVVGHSPGEYRHESKTVNG